MIRKTQACLDNYTLYIHIVVDSTYSGRLSYISGHTYMKLGVKL